MNRSASFGASCAPDLEVIGVAVQEEQGGTAAEFGHSEAATARCSESRRGEQHQARSSMAQSAARMPEMAQKLTHWPGWVALPQR